MKNANNRHPTLAWALALAVATAMTVAVQSSAATWYVSGPSTNASPLRFKAIGAGEWHSLGVLSNGTVLAWGNTNLGQSTVPSGLSGVVAVAGGDDHSLALKADGTVVAWGNNYYDQTDEPAGLSNVVGIAAGELHSLAVKSDGTVVAWGIGQPGAPVDANDYDQSLLPGGLSGVVAVAAGYAHNLALQSDGTVSAWGRGQTVNPSDGVDYGQAIVPSGLSNVVAIAAGSYHSLALKSDGTVVAWGDNRFGQTNVPSGLSGVVAIAARIYNSMALQSNGTVVTWGWPLNQDPVPGLSNVVAIAAGGQHDLALESDGTVVAWGDNRFGQASVPGAVVADQNIQDAVNAANDGDTILVGPGEYDLTSQITITKAIALQSEMGAGQTFLNVDFDDYGLWVSNSAAVIDGFTIQNPGGTSVNAGGAFLVGGTVQDCTFTNFYLPAPGPGNSVSMVGGTLSNSVVAFTRIPPGFYPTAVDCADGGLVTGCRVLINGDGNGVGIHLSNSQMRNSAVSGTGEACGVCNSGPAVSASGSMITACTITGNASMNPGGGAYLDSCLMDRCVLAYNTSRSVGGGGIFETNSTIRDSLIVSNSANIAQPGAPQGRGGGVYMQGGGLVNCTVSEDSAVDSEEGPGQGGGIYVESGGITNSIIYFNYATVGNNWTNTGSGVFDHCCTTPDPGGAGNIIQDPQFVDLADGNFHLATNSPCLAAGVVQFWMDNAFDLDGNPRTVNGFVDMGAYQNQSVSQKQTVPQLVAIQNPQCVGTGTSSGFVFSFPTQTNRTYTVQYTYSLAPADWQPLTTIPGDGTMMSYTNHETISPVCFYRVVAQ